jgi:DNA-binding NarL/FixJ family response regulator
MSDSFKIVLADEHVLFLDGLTALLSQLGYRVVATATTRRTLLEHLRLFEPDICVTGTRFPDGEGADVIDPIAQAHPSVKIVVLTADGDPDTMRMALEAGASGYLHKSRSVSILIDLFHRVMTGEIVVEGSFLRPAKYGRRRTDKETPPQLHRLATYLTPRELECLALLADGMDTATIARRLGVSRPTVRSHVQAVLTKLGVHSRLEAASLAIRFGLVGNAPDDRAVQGY